MASRAEKMYGKGKKIQDADDKGGGGDGGSGCRKRRPKRLLKTAGGHQV